MAWLLVVLCALPPVLLVVAHIYGNYAQDQRITVVVQLRSKKKIDLLSDDHARRYKVDVLQSWDSGAQKGYRATISLRNLAKLKHDPRVLIVDRID